ncbi:MAG: hypothetical protein QGH58_10440 [Arenicellales bacterium]|nr:hypothetical protein [Arenicellales bacterium]
MLAESFSRHIQRDEANGITRLNVESDTGMLRLTDLGWEHGSVSRQFYEITDGEPNSNKAQLHWTMRFRRPDTGLDVRTETHSTLQSTSTDFHFSASLEAFEGEDRVYFSEWERKFPRDLN